MFAKLNAILGEYDMDERIVARNVPTWAALNDRHDVLSAELVLSLMRAYGEHAMADLYDATRPRSKRGWTPASEQSMSTPYIRNWPWTSQPVVQPPYRGVSRHA